MRGTNLKSKKKRPKISFIETVKRWNEVEKSRLLKGTPMALTKCAYQISTA